MFNIYTFELRTGNRNGLFSDENSVRNGWGVLRFAGISEKDESYAVECGIST